MLHIDLETRSHCNLLKAGTYNYATHPTTEVICMCWAKDDGPVETWIPGDSWPVWDEDVFCAHNAQFERLIFKHVLGINTDHDQWLCTATLARAHALPGSLGDCARALRLHYQKDRRGEELIKLMSIPPYDESDGLLGEMVDYCQRDVEVEREIYNTLPGLSDEIWAGYDVSERINDRGLLVDVELAEAVVPLAEAEQQSINRALADETGGDVLKPRSPKLTTWVYERLPLELRSIMQDDSKKSGMSLGGSVVTELLNVVEDQQVKRVLELKALASKSSVAKFQAMQDLAGPDNRVRGAYLYLGAAQTGRFSSRGLQVHNLPRDCSKTPDEDRDLIMRGGLGGQVMKTLAAMLRPSIWAGSGSQFVCSDWAGIEARALPWLAGADDMLNVFREGLDVYVEAAKDIYGPAFVDGDKDQRQIGKVAVLSLGYGGAVGAFQSMARNYGVRVSDGRARRIVDSWREGNPWATQFWGNLMMAAHDAIRHGSAEVGVLRYEYEQDHLFCVLPSGRRLMYPWVERKAVENRWGVEMELSCIKSSLVPAQGKDWPRMRLWGGLLAENVTQAMCADLLIGSLVKLDGLCDYVVGHTHDEILMEVPAGDVFHAMDMLEDVMLEVPDWAAGLPLAVESWRGSYYRK